MKSFEKHLTIKRHGLIERIIRLLMNNYYLFVMGLYLVAMRVEKLRVGVLASVIMLLIFSLIFIKNGINYRITTLDCFVILFLFYCIISGVNYSIESIPLSLFFQSVANSLLPIGFYYCGVKGYSFSPKRYLLAIDVSCIIGLYLVFKLPNWYYFFCKDHGYSYTRLSSCVGSTAIGTLSCVAILYSFSLMMENRKSISIKVQYILSCGFAFLSFQRSAWFVAFVSILVFHYYLLKWHIIKLRLLVIEFLSLLCVIIVGWDYVVNRISVWQAERRYAAAHSSPNDASFLGRGNQWSEALSNSNWLFGSGYGTRGHRTVSVGVADGDFVRLLCEIGIIGIVIFLFIVVLAVNNGKSDKRKAIVPFFVILVMLLQCIGSNILEYQVLAPLFWISIGELTRIRKEKNGERINEDISFISAPIS